MLSESVAKLQPITFDFHIPYTGIIDFSYEKIYYYNYHQCHANIHQFDIQLYIL